MALRLGLIAALFIAGCLGDGTCPCGALPSDPLSEHDPSFLGEHELHTEADCESCGPDAGR